MPPFDLQSATALDHTQTAVNTTSFDINSAKEEPQIQNATTSGNPVSGFVGFLRNIFGSSPIEELNRTANLYANSDQVPQPVQGEDMAKYAQRVNSSDVVKNYEGPILQEGVMRQLQGPMNLAVGASALEAPAMTAAVVGGFSVIDKFFNAREILNKYAPDTPPELKDAAEIVSMLAIGGGLAHGVGLGKTYLSEKLNSLNIPDSTLVTPDDLQKFKESKVLTDQEKGDVLTKMGINAAHIEAAVSADIPIKVPLTNIVDVAQEPYWNDVKDIINPEASTKSSSSGQDLQQEVNQTQGGTNEKGKNQAGQESLLNEAKPGLASPASLDVPKGDQPSGLSLSVERSAIKEGLTKDLGELPSYQKRDMGDIANKVSEFINNDHELAKKIALGDAPEQDGLRSQELYTGLRIKAEAEGDVNTLRDLALSDKAATMATELGQRVKALDAGTEDSPIEAIKQVKKAREDALTKNSKSKNIDSQKKSIIKEIQKEVKKNVPTKETWASFVDALQC